MHAYAAACFAAGGRNKPPLTGRDFNEHGTLSALSGFSLLSVARPRKSLPGERSCALQLPHSACGQLQQQQKTLHVRMYVHMAHNRYLCRFAAVTRQQTSTLVDS